MTSPTRACIESFFDAVTFTATHLVWCERTRQAAVIDSVLDYNAASGRTATHAADRVVDFVAARGLQLQWLLETHAHADHFSAAPYLRQRLGGRIAIGRRITELQGHFKSLFNAADMATDGAPFDQLFDDGEVFAIGDLRCSVMHTPGHTPACVSYAIGDDVFVGDTLFMPDYGSARCDFPGGDARALYTSIRRLLALPGHTRLRLCHDYQPGGRTAVWTSTVDEQRAGNVHVREGISLEDFVAMREARDKTLGTPALMLPAVQVNVRAGQWPTPEANGLSYLKIPLNGW